MTAVEILQVPELGELEAPARYFERNSRSFWFASAFMGREDRDRVAEVYAWCRYTDDIVDRAVDPSEASARLARWAELSLAAYGGEVTGIALLDSLMGRMRVEGVRVCYAEALIRGVASDLEPRMFENLGEVHAYAHLVAGVVGEWLTEMQGVHDRWMLERAALLGRAMQLTNILRDVGEDWDRGRLYLPIDRLFNVGLVAEDVGALRARPERIGRQWRALMEELMEVASRDYRAAREAIPLLPPQFGRAVSVAAMVYEGIHDAIRRNGYDNLTRRAVVSFPRKLALATRALSVSAPKQACS